MTEGASMASRFKRFLIAGTLAGLTIVLGEVVLNGWLLLAEWQHSIARLGLAQPDGTVVTAGFVKLFVLGFVVAWLDTVFANRYGSWTKGALFSGGLIAALIWVWVMVGMLMAGYVTFRIAWITMIWGAIELPIAALVAARVLRPKIA